MITITLHRNGMRRPLSCKNVYDEDAEWFKSRGVILSMEELGNRFIVYADIGRTTLDGEPDEIIVFDEGRSCEETLRALKVSCEQALM